MIEDNKLHRYAGEIILCLQIVFIVSGVICYGADTSSIITCSISTASLHRLVYRLQHYQCTK